MTQPDTSISTQEPFNQFNFNFEILKLVEELAKKAFSDSSIRTKIAQNKIAELWDSVEREILRQLAAEDEAVRKRYDI